MQNNTEVQKKQYYRRLTNISLLVFGILMSASGLYIQIHYHMLNGGNSGFTQWSFIHKWSALLFTLVVIAHIALHVKWYKVVFEKRIVRKNRVTLILTVVMIVVSLLGFSPYILTLFPAQSGLRHTLIEIHDKIGVVFMVIVIGHILKRWKWYINRLPSGKKLNRPHN